MRRKLIASAVMVAAAPVLCSATAEAGSPSALSLIGWTKNSVKPGDVIAAYVFQSKTGHSVGRLNKIVLADGTSLKDSALGDQKYDKSE